MNKKTISNYDFDKLKHLNTRFHNLIRTFRICEEMTGKEFIQGLFVVLKHYIKSYELEDFGGKFISIKPTFNISQNKDDSEASKKSLRFASILMQRIDSVNDTAYENEMPINLRTAILASLSLEILWVAGKQSVVFDGIKADISDVGMEWLKQYRHYGEALNNVK